MTQTTTPAWSAQSQEPSQVALREASRRAALLGAAAGGDQELRRLSADPLLLRDAINQAIARVEGADRLIHGQFYMALEGSEGARRFRERGLPELGAEEAKAWAKEMLEAGQEHPLKKDLAALEISILTGDAPMVGQILSRAPMAPWVMDFTLREYEAENLMTFAAKYAPAPADFEIIDLFLAEGLKAPDRTAYARLEAPALASAMPGFTHKGAQRVGECLERAGWAFCFFDYLLLFARAREELGNAGRPGETLRESLLEQKVEMARWLAGRGVSPSQRLPVGAEPAAWEEILSPAQGAWVRQAFAEGAARGEAVDFGLAEVFSRPGAPFRKEGQWGILGPWMIEAGLDVSKIMSQSEESGLSHTAAWALPWAQKQQLLAVCEPARKAPEESMRL